MARTKTCESCAHLCDQGSFDISDVTISGNRLIYFHCRRFPPPFPKVQQDWWCGEHKPIKADKAKKEI